jgi:hypothetical protein
LTWYSPHAEWTALPIEKLQEYGRLIGHIENVEISGGEPTLHPEFEAIARDIHDILDCPNIWLVTNGWLFREHPEKLPLLDCFDTVYFSYYTDEFVARYGTRSNADIVRAVAEYAQKHGHKGVHVEAIDWHIPYHLPDGDGVPCWWYPADMISLYDGTLYGCCVAWGLKYKGRGIPLTADWREHLKEIDLPCERCMNTGR